MIVLVPLSRFRITFEIGCGRPYSTLESLILQTAEQGAATLDELQDTFGIHRRLLIEALVTLTQAGWLAVSSVPDKSFLITPEGRQALTSGDAPSSLTILPKESYVLRERLTGGILSSRDVRYVTKRDLEDVWGQCVRHPPQIGDKQVDGSRVQHLLPRAQGEWIRWIGPIELVGRDFHWLPVTVDLNAKTVTGLPDTWSHLRDALLTEASRRGSALSTGSRSAVWTNQPLVRTEAPQSAPPEWLVTLSADDFLYDSAAHENLLREVLGRAVSSVFVASAFITRARLESIQTQLGESLRRGVSVDFLWGYDAEPEALNWLTNQAIEARREGWPGRVRFNRNASKSHAKLLIWDRSTDVFEACVGSCNWLSFGEGATKGPGPAEISIKFSQPGLVAQLSRCAASLWEGTKDALSAVPNRWQRAAAEMDRVHVTSPTAQKPNARVSIVLDHDHERLLREWLRTAEQRLLVMSHRLGPVSATRLLAAEGRTRNADFSYDVTYGYTELDTSSLSQAEEAVMNASGRFLHAPNQHAKVVVCDDVACVSSYNFLSADPFQTASGAREVGVVLDGSEPVGWLVERLLPKTS